MMSLSSCSTDILHRGSWGHMSGERGYISSDFPPLNYSGTCLASQPPLHDEDSLTSNTFRHLSGGGPSEPRPSACRTFDLLLTIVDELWSDTHSPTHTYRLTHTRAPTDAAVCLSVQWSWTLICCCCSLTWCTAF